MSCSNTCLLLHLLCTIYWFPSNLSKVTQYFAFTFESDRIFEIPVGSKPEKSPILFTIATPASQWISRHISDSQCFPAAFHSKTINCRLIVEHNSRIWGFFLWVLILYQKENSRLLSTSSSVNVPLRMRTCITAVSFGVITAGALGHSWPNNLHTKHRTVNK